MKRIDLEKSLERGTLSAMPAPPTILIAERPVLIFEQIHHLPRERIQFRAQETTSITFQCRTLSCLFCFRPRSLGNKQFFGSRHNLCRNTYIGIRSQTCRRLAAYERDKLSS